jgi:6-pyruvoyltetrahydropterin/6-carboxytetrahydropterin synthase
MLITKQFKSETAHIVRNAHSKRCAYSIHGHSYIYEVTLKGEVNEKDGMLLDFIRMEPIRDIIDSFDHTTVLWENENQSIIDFFLGYFERVMIMRKNPTAENMASLIFNEVEKWLKKANLSDKIKTHNVKIWETKTGSATSSLEDIDDDDVIVYFSPSLEKEISK